MTSTPLPGRLRRIYRGWIVVAAGCLAETIALGAGGSSFSVLLQPMSAGLRWSRTLLTGAVTTQSILNLGTSPIIGTATDRYGPRIVMVAGAAVASVGYLLIGRIVDPIPFYIVFALAGAAGLSACGPLVTETVVAKWFTRQRGRALAITAMGLDFGNILMVPLTALLIAAVGWQATWMVLGTIIAMVLLPVSTAFMSSPKAGDVPEDEASSARGRSAETTAVWTAREAFFKGSLWKLILAFNLASVAASALIYHLAAYFLDSGFTLQQASLVLAMNRVFAIGSKLIWGFLAERVPVRYCLAGNSLGRATGFLILLLSSDPRRAYLFRAGWRALRQRVRAAAGADSGGLLRQRQPGRNPGYHGALWPHLRAAGTAASRIRLGPDGKLQRRVLGVYYCADAERGCSTGGQAAESAGAGG